MKPFSDLVIQAWDATSNCPDAFFAQPICPNCLAQKLEPLMEAYFADKLLQQSGQHRASDKVTARDAASLITAKATTARVQLLLAHYTHPDGLTDEEACALAGLSVMSEFRTRCSELMRSGVIEDLTLTRPSSAGVDNVVRRITETGVRVIHMRQQRDYPTTD